MSDIKLFRYANNGASELAGKSAAIERTLQRLIESQMETFLGVRFLATEYSTGAKHRGRIDSLGLDENGCPVIIEYKRHSNENMMNQGLFYLDWLLDHKADFRFLVMDKLGKDEADKIEWGGTRLSAYAPWSLRRRPAERGRIQPAQDGSGVLSRRRASQTGADFSGMGREI